MEQNRKILMIDKSPERKTRIRALKGRGFAVYPALNIAEARNRCKPGSYDLIVVNSSEQPESALELCTEIRERAPKQLVILMADPETPVPALDYIVSGNEAALVERVESLLRGRSGNGEAAIAA